MGFKIIIILAVLLVAYVVYQQGYIQLPSMGWISPGWEVYNQMGGMRFVTDTGSRIYTSASQFNPKENDVTSSYWKVDIDNETYGVPTMMVEVSDIQHTDWSGGQLGWDQYVDTRNVTRGNYTYFLDYHIYTFTVVIRTEADKMHYTESGDPVNNNRVFHETAWPYIGQDPFGQIPGPEIGKEFSGAAYVKFIINPWKGVTYRVGPNGSYTLDDCWAGVMNAHVIGKTQGTVANQWGTIPTPESDAQFYVRGGIDIGYQIPMFADDGTFGNPAPITDWGAASPDNRIASNVVLQLPIEEMAGGDTHFNGWGQVDDIYPVDVAVQYTVRVDVLQSHGFVLQGGNPPEVTWPEDYFGWSEDFWTSLLAGLNPFGFLGPLSPLAWFIVTLIAIAVIILILIAIFAPWMLPGIFRGLGQARDFAYESVEKRPRRR